MLMLLLHFWLGLIIGTRFGVQTLLLIAVLLSLGFLVAPLFGVSAGIYRWFCAEMLLQAGYLGGAMLRSVVDRFAPVIGLHPSSDADLG
jgi:hypothetical protein